MAPKSPQSPEVPSGFSAKQRMIAVLTIPCSRHQGHIVTISSDDEEAWEIGDFVQEHFPLEGITQCQYRIKVYSPLADYEGL